MPREGLECKGKEKGRLIADDDGRLFVDWTEPVYEAREPGGALSEVGTRQYVVVSDGAKITEFAPSTPSGARASIVASVCAHSRRCC